MSAPMLPGSQVWNNPLSPGTLSLWLHSGITWITNALFLTLVTDYSLDCIRYQRLLSQGEHLLASVCPSGFVRASLCTNSLVQDRSIFMFDNEHSNQSSHCSSVPTYILVAHNIALYWLSGAQDKFACSLSTFFDGVQCSVVSPSVRSPLLEYKHYQS